MWVSLSGGLRDCYKFIKDKQFFCIHFKYDPETLLKTIDQRQINDPGEVEKFIFESDICLGVLTKRGNASIKSMLKVYKLDKEYQSFVKAKHPAQPQMGIATQHNENSAQVAP